jgi:hypothetical protein
MYSAFFAGHFVIFTSNRGMKAGAFIRYFTRIVGTTDIPTRRI